MPPVRPVVTRRHASRALRTVCEYSVVVQFDHDFAIVGSGFGGSVSALRLSEKGYSVVVLEMGKRWKREDFPKTTWDVRKYLWRPWLGMYGILQMTLVKDAFFLHGAGVGGGSLVYANTLLVPPPSAFGDARWVGLDWKATLEPHYTTAKRMLGAVPSEVVVETDRSGAWVADYYPTESVVELGEGRRRITLLVADPSWVRRLAWRMGGHVTVLSPPHLRSSVAAGADEALAAYAVSSPSGPALDTDAG